MEKKYINDGLDDLFGPDDDEVMPQNKSSEFEELIFKALSPFYREHLINTYRDLISKAVKSEASNVFIDDYIFLSAEAMASTDGEIAERLKECIAMKREESEEDYLTELFATVTFFP